MNIVARLDACITNMQSICNSIGMEATVEAIAGHTADELAECRDIAKELLAALKAVLFNETCAGAFAAAILPDTEFAKDVTEYAADCAADAALLEQITLAVAKAERGAT